MAAAPCKVILCGDPPRNANQQLVEFAKAVKAGDIPETELVKQTLMNAAKAQENAAALLSSAFNVCMAAAFPSADADRG